MADLDIEKAIKYPFQDKQWLSKVGIFAALWLVSYIISQVIQFGTEFSTSFTRELSDSQDVKFLSTLVPYGIQFAVSILLLPLTLYLEGYILVVVKNVMNKVENPIPFHDEIGAKFSLALKALAISIITGLISLVVAAIAFVPLFAGIGMTSDNNSIGWVLIAFGGFMTLVFIALAIYMSIFLVPALTYRLLKTNSLSETLSYEVFNVINKSWQDLLLLCGVLIVIGIGIAIVSLFLTFLTCGCGAIFITPIIGILSLFIEAYIRGDVYGDMLAKGV